MQSRPCRSATDKRAHPWLRQKFFAPGGRARSAALFRSLFTLDAKTRILDLGSAGGAHISAMLKGTPVQPANVYVADIRPASVERASRAYATRRC